MSSSGHWLLELHGIAGSFLASPCGGVCVCVRVPVTVSAVMVPLFVFFVLAVSDPLLILTRQGGG